MRSQRRCRLALAVLLVAIAFCLQSSAQPAAKAAPECKIPQSPRKLADYNNTNPMPTFFREANVGAIVYKPRGSESKQTLSICSQHYHCWIENLQPGCQGQRATSTGGPVKCEEAKVGDWVEIHTVYSPKLGNKCEGNYESTKCCEGNPEDPSAPIVVIAYHAKVTARPAVDTRCLPPGSPGRIAKVPVCWGQQSAEWSGSTTGPPNDTCKAAALWSFALGCDMKVSQEELGKFTQRDRARGLQSSERLSNDLTHVLPK
ncbi:MAG TPA: hypothetical protein VHR45_07725 [Thermoanaerobaculia bacterium]|nr:hypothetical protein [Thermoanaerobaculia bacterium]